ncbi:MAG: hypothetical protein NVSMB18_27950 [Acetobacteraceae bacterium]
MASHGARKQVFGATQDGRASQLVQRGLKLREAGRLEQALASFTAATLLAPNHLSALARQAATLAGLGRHAEAVVAWERVNRLCPGDRHVAAGLGAALIAADRRQDALMWLNAACAAHATDATLLTLMAQALLQLEQRGAAIGALYMAAELRPDDADILGELGKALFHDGSPDAALELCRKAYAASATAGHAATLSCVLIDLGRCAEALAVIEVGLRDDQRSMELLINRSIALQGSGCGTESVEAAREALAAALDHPIAQHHLAATLLGRGDMTDESWALYEGRLGLKGARAWPDPARRWTGGDVAGRTVLLHAEQGLGDTLQFVRYAPHVAALGARVVLAVQSGLVRLLQGTAGVAEVVAVGSALPEFDLYCPLLSLPGLFRTTLASVPPVLQYYIDRPARERGGPLRVGLAWAGNPEFVDDRKRSIDPSLLAPLRDVAGTAFFGLQFGAQSCPAELPIVDLMRDVKDFRDTAEAIAGLDLVITVDTAVAHLAGTIGVPVWLLSRFRGCWRWLEGREDSPWYPGMRVFRQAEPNDWRGLVARVREDLEMAASQRFDQRAECSVGSFTADRLG